MRSGTLDIIIGGLREPRLAGVAQEIELFADPYVVAVRKGHRLARRKSVALPNLADHDWVMPQHNVPRRAVIDSIFAQLPVKPPLVLETSSLAMMLAMLMESDCLTLLSRAQIHDAYPGRELVALELELPEASRAVGYTVRTDWLGTALQQAFVEGLRAESESEQ